MNLSKRKENCDKNRFFVVVCFSVQKGGGFAEYALAPVTSTVKRPANVSAVDAASLPVAAMTALQSAVNLVGLKLDGSGPKLNILITAASGGVGLFWTQVSTASLSQLHKQILNNNN